MLVAGCSGAVTDGTPTSSVTPVDIPDTARTPSTIPGVTDGILVDPAVLAEAHRSELDDEGYTRVWSERSTSGDDLRWEMTARVRIDTSGQTYTTLEIQGPNSPATVPREATRVEKYTEDGNAWTAVWRDDSLTVFPERNRLALGGTDIAQVLAAVNLRVFSQERRKEGVRFRLRGTESSNETALEAATPFHDPVKPRLDATVTPRGVVQSYVFTYALANPPYISEQRFTRSFRIEAVGETTVSRPDWVPESGENATTTAPG